MPPKSTKRTTVDPNALLARVNGGKTVSSYRRKQVVFAQGSPADVVYYVQKGRVRLSVVSNQGKEAVVGFVMPDMFFGEGCLAGQQLRMSTATVTEETSLVQFSKETMMRLLHTDPKFSELFTTYLLSRNIRFEEDLVDQLFNSSEKRLARILLLLAHFGNEGAPENVVPAISQATLAEMVGTTRSRVNFFMNRFRKLGFIEYDGGIEVHSSLLRVVLDD